MPLSPVTCIFSSEQVNTHCLYLLIFLYFWEFSACTIKYDHIYMPFPLQLPPPVFLLRCPSQLPVLIFFLTFFDNMLRLVSATHIFMAVIHPLEHGNPGRVHFLSKNDVSSTQQLWIANGSSVTVGLGDPLSHLCWPCTDNHSCHESKSALTTSCPEDSISQYPSHSLALTFLCLFCNEPWWLWG